MGWREEHIDEYCMQREGGREGSEGLQRAKCAASRPGVVDCRHCGQREARGWQSQRCGGWRGEGCSHCGQRGGEGVAVIAQRSETPNRFLLI